MQFESVSTLIIPSIAQLVGAMKHLVVAFRAHHGFTGVSLEPCSYVSSEQRFHLSSHRFSPTTFVPQDPPTQLVSTWLCLGCPEFKSSVDSTTFTLWLLVSKWLCSQHSRHRPFYWRENMVKSHRRGHTRQKELCILEAAQDVSSILLFFHQTLFQGTGAHRRSSPCVRFFISRSTSSSYHILYHRPLSCYGTEKYKVCCLL